MPKFHIHYEKIVTESKHLETTVNKNNNLIQIHNLEKSSQYKT